jgi:hypothetical protein
VNLPPLPKRSIKTALSYHIRSLYPGDPGVSRIDYLPNGGCRGAFLVFVSTRERLERGGVGNKGCVSSTALLLALTRKSKRPSVGIFIAERWIEIAAFAERKFAWSFCVRREGGAGDDLRLALAQAQLSGEGEVVLVRESDEAGEDEIVRASLEKRSLALREAMSLDEALRRVRRSSCVIFTPGARGHARRRAALGLVAALAGGCAIFALIRHGQEIERGLAAKRLEVARLKSAEARSKDAEAELRRLQNEYAKILEDRQPDLYDVIAEAACKLPRDAHILGFRYDGSSLAIEAEGGDAFAALRSFSGDSGYVSARLERSAPAAFGRERFSISVKRSRAADAVGIRGVGDVAAGPGGAAVDPIPIEDRITRTKVLIAQASASLRPGRGTVADWGAEIREALGRAGIHSSSCRVSGSGAEESMEFTLGAGTKAFLRFLYGAKMNRKIPQLSFVSLRNDFEAGKIDAVFRARAEHAPGSALVSGSSALASASNFEAVLRAFVGARPAILSAPAKTPAASGTPMTLHPSQPVRASYLHALGSLDEASGARWLFFKDDRRGRVLKLRFCGDEAQGKAAQGSEAQARGSQGSVSAPPRLVAEDKERYVLEIEGEFVSVGKVPR